MTTLSYTVAMPAGATSGTWELRPEIPYSVVGSVGVVAPFRGNITSSGVLVAKDGSAAQVVVPASGGYDAGMGLLQINFNIGVGVTLPGKPIEVQLVETSTGVMDVAYLINTGRGQILTPQQAADILTLISQTTAAKNAANAAAANANTAAAGVASLATTLTGPVIANANAATSSANTAAASAVAAAGMIPWFGGDHTTLPNTLGSYRILTGDESGQVWSRATNNAAPTRVPALEVLTLLMLARTPMPIAGTITGLKAGEYRQLGAGLFIMPQGVLPDGVVLEGIPGKTILQPVPGPHAADLAQWMTVNAGQAATFRDIILDGLNQYCYGVFTSGKLDFVRGQVINFLGTAGNGAFALTQNSVSTYMTVRGTYFTGIHAPPDGAYSNAVGAARAVYFTGTGGKVRDCIFESVGDFEDGDPVHYFRALDANDGWTSAGHGRVTNSTFIGFGKRGVKVQASDVEVDGNNFTNTVTDLTLSPHAAIEIFGSRCFVHHNRIDLARSTYGIIISYVNAHDNKITDNTIRNGVDGAYSSSRDGNSVSGYFDLGHDNLFSGNSVESGLYAVYLYTGCVNPLVVNNPRLIGRQAQVIGNNSTGATITGNNIGGSTAYTTSVGIFHDTGSSGAVVKNNNFSNLLQGQRLVGAATGHILGAQTYKNVPTPVGYSSSTGVNIVADSTGYQTPPASTMDLPSFELLMPDGNLNPHYDRDHSDALENISHRLANVPVVNVTGVNNSTTSFTALGLTAHSGLQGGMPVDFGAASPSAYPLVAEVNLGTQSIPLSNGRNKFYPALLFSTTPAGLSSVVIEVDTGSGYVAMSTTNVTAARHIRLPGFTATSAIKKIRYTLNGTTPASGTFIWRRVLLHYPEFGATQTKHPGWAEFRKGHNADGTHASVNPSLTFGPITAGAVATQTVPLGGVTTSDRVIAIPQGLLPTGVSYYPYVSGASVVTIVMQNNTAATITPPNLGWIVGLLR